MRFSANPRGYRKFLIFFLILRAKARSSIIDKQTPTQRRISKAEVELIKPLIKNIKNDKQSRAIIKSLICQDYFLLEMNSGEGNILRKDTFDCFLDKTNTIVTIIRCLNKLGKRVLLSAFSGNSLETILVELSKVSLF